MIDTAILLTTYNRPKLVTEAIKSVITQSCRNWRLYILDDGCNDVARDHIEAALKLLAPEDGVLITERTSGKIDDTAARVVWWRGPDRDMFERKRTISYSRSLNFAINYLLQDEPFVTYLCDDDVLHQTAIATRREYLRTHPQVHVCYGRLRAVQFGATGTRNQWKDSGAPFPGVTATFPRPTGPIELIHDGKAAHVYYDPKRDGIGEDPDTGLPYVECAFFMLGPSTYGVDGMVDHNQVMHRRECLTDCRRDSWYGTADTGGVQYWGEDMRHGVGDAAFFALLGQKHAFHGIDEWVVTKCYHGFSDGVQHGEVRE